MTWTHPALEAVVRLLGERTGLHFPPERQDSAEQGIRRAMTRAGVTDLDRYRALVGSDAVAFDDLIVELTVGETYFFREPAQFAFIQGVILPEIVRRLGPEHWVRAWSAGCASGEEAYSLAIVFALQGLVGQAHLLATDVSRAALARGCRAAYSGWSLRGDGAHAAAPYLQRKKNLHILDDAIRRAVTFEYLNLALAVYPSFATGTWGMDLILCRNVLIYFDRETLRAVALRLFESLAPGGWLVTASSDPPLDREAPFEPVVTDSGVFYRRPLERVSPTPDFGIGDPAGGQFNDVSPSPPALTAPSPAQSSPPEGRSPTVDDARESFARGDYARAAELTRGLTTDAGACALRVRALSNVETARAEQACAAAAGHHPLAAEIHYLHAVLLLELGREEEAVRAVRRVVYLDRSLAVGHFTLGSILIRRGDQEGARRAYRNARDLCAARPADEALPLSDGEHAGRLLEAVEAQLAVLEATPEVTR
jgi:chemotaxis protein methyltransferase CheR